MTPTLSRRGIICDDVSNTVIEGNTFEYERQAINGLFRNVVVCGNTFKGYYNETAGNLSGIILATGSHGSVVGNTLTGYTGHVSIDCPDSLVRGNVTDQAIASGNVTDVNMLVS